jgi:hypothetical protein
MKSRPWGDGTLLIGLDFDRNQVIAAYEAKGRTWGPADLMEIPENWPAERYDYLADSWWAAFDAKRGGEKFFADKFGEEAANLAYGAWRKKAKAARKVIGKEDALKIAQNLIESFYVDAPPWKTPFDNWAMVNKLSEMTFGKFSVAEIMKLLEEASGLYWESH